MKPTPDDPGTSEAPPSPGTEFGTYYADEGTGAGGELDADPVPTLRGKTFPLFGEPDPPPTFDHRPDRDQGQGRGDASEPEGSEIGPGTGTASRRGVVGLIEPGQTLYSKYQVLRKLGGGAMGDVWLVRHAALKSQHALKVIVPNFATSSVALMRFQREFEIMATLRHEHAVTIYDACIDADGGYIDMEYVEGRTIHEILGQARARAGRDPGAPLMPLDWIVRVLDQFCEVLQVAHDKGIVHRDLKPSNMMLVDGRPAGREYLKVLDFGIAKIRDDPEGVAAREQEKTQGFIGTPSYASPEQMMGHDVDGRADLYAVGIMLYEFVAGRVPFRGNHWLVMSQHVSSPPPPFAETSPELRPMPALEQAIFRALAKDPDKRPPTAAELYHEIREAVRAIRPAGSTGLTPPTWDALPAYSSPIEPAAPTHADHHGGEPPGTEAATFVGKSSGPGWRGQAATDGLVEIGRAKGLAGGARARWTFRGLSPSKKWALSIALTACSAMLLLVAFRPARPPAPIKADRRPEVPVASEPPRPRPVDFEGYWEGIYRPIDPSPGSMPWPDKVRRTTDEATFRKFADGIYIPDTFEPEDPKDLAADGWPKAIARKGVRFVRIPGGTWTMGAWDDPVALNRADAPAHAVRLTGFYLQETEVTNGQFDDYLAETNRARPPEWEWTFNELKQKGPELARKYPATNLTRKNALGFCAWMGGQLPTEAQWEYAARSLGKRQNYVWGDTPPPGRELARIDADDATPAPVRAYARDRTEQGVFDLNGNVQEMCRDAWLAFMKFDAPDRDPCPVPADPNKADYAIRGAAYSSPPSQAAITRRDDRAPGVDPAENLGFRAVLECPDARKPR